jgi:hypothetical protein
MSGDRSVSIPNQINTLDRLRGKVQAIGGGGTTTTFLSKSVSFLAADDD